MCPNFLSPLNPESRIFWAAQKSSHTQAKHMLAAFFLTEYLKVGIR